MEEIIMPDSSSSQNNQLPPGYQKYAIPDTLKEKDRNSLFYEQLQAVVQKQIELEQTLNRHKLEIEESSKSIKDGSNRNIEILGLFSSILALLIINVNIISTSKSFLAAILLCISLTCTVSIFCILLHAFFNISPQKKITNKFWIPISILGAIIAIGIIIEITDYKLNPISDNNPTNYQEQKTEN